MRGGGGWEREAWATSLPSLSVVQAVAYCCHSSVPSPLDSAQVRSRIRTVCGSRLQPARRRGTDGTDAQRRDDCLTNERTNGASKARAARPPPRVGTSPHAALRPPPLPPHLRLRPLALLSLPARRRRRGHRVAHDVLHLAHDERRVARWVHEGWGLGWQCAGRLPVSSLSRARKNRERESGLGQGRKEGRKD